MKNPGPLQLFRLVMVAMAVYGAAQQAWAAPATTTTTLTVTSDGSPVTEVTAGSVVTLTAKVMAGSTPVTVGQVEFCDATVTYCTDIHQLGMAQLTSVGTAVFKFRPGDGSHSYNAVFFGTNNNAGSTSGTALLTVSGPEPTVTTIAQSGSTGDYTLTATVDGTGSVAPAGTVSFLNTSNGNAVLGTPALIASTNGISFLDPTPVPVGLPPTGFYGVAAGDFNGDGILDYVVASSAVCDTATCYNGWVRVMLGNGDGVSFTPSTMLDLGPDFNLDSENSLVVGDFNMDGIPDLALACGDSLNLVSESVLILQGNGDGTFTVKGNTAVENGYSMVGGDFNGDGIPDLAIFVENEYASSTANTVTVLLGNGDGTFTNQEVTTLSNDVGDTMAVGDFNKDGILDLALVSESSISTAGWVTILLGNGDGTFTNTGAPPAIGNEPDSIAVGDFSGNGVLDLAVLNSESYSISVLMGNGNGTFTPAAGSPISLGTNFALYIILVGNFNGDGNADLAVSLGTDKAPGVLLGNGNGTFTAATTSSNLAAESQDGFYALGDFNGDGISDLLVLVSSDELINNPAAVSLTATQTATATLTNISPAGVAGTSESVLASYAGNNDYNASTSQTTQLGAVILEPTVTVTPSATSITTAQTLSVTVTVAGGIGNPTPTGSVVLSSGSYLSSATILSNGSATINVPADNLAVSTDTLTAYYTPDTAGSTYYDPSSGSNNVSVSAASQAAIPTISPAAGTYTSAQTVTIGDATSGVAIYYTTNGSTPTTGSAVYSTPIPVSTSETLQAIAKASGYVTSAVGSAVYSFPTPASMPAFNPGSGAYDTAQTVTISDASAGTTIYYTTNGTLPTTNSTIYINPISVSVTETVEAMAAGNGNSNSAVGSGIYTLEVATPRFSPTAGSYATAQSVTISDITQGAVFYYTTNGTTPTTGSAFYSAPIPVSASETVEVIATLTGYTNSATGIAAYTIADPAATPTFSPGAGTYTSDQTVTIHTTTPSATIYYTTNGTMPTTASTAYTGPISVSATMSMEAIAVGNGIASSPPGSAAYTIELSAAIPTFSPAAGSYTTAQTVSLGDTTADAKIYYTTNGTTPTTGSTIYKSPISVSATMTIEAIAGASGATSSAAASAAYTIKTSAAAPIFSPAAGSYTTTRTITISDATAGATIYYTTNKTTPTTASARYTAAIAVSTTETLEAISVATGYSSSSVATAAYTISHTAATPSFSEAGGIYATAQTVSISDATAGATIYYTTNGTSPTTASTKYSKAIKVSSTETIEALAAASGYTSSSIATAKYTIK